MTDLNFLFFVLAALAAATVSLLGALVTLLARWDRQYLRETAFLLDQNSLRNTVRAEARLQRSLERMDAHIAMVLERVDRDRR